MRRPARIIALTLLLACAACGRPASPSDARVAFDPELVDREPGSFRQTFDGPASKIFLGTGWYGLESLEKVGPWSGFSWASSSATVYFGMPLPGEVELAARVAPFGYPGAPAQALTPVVNGFVLPAVALPEGWQEIRVPLGSRLLRAPVNTLELRFAYARKPSQEVAGSVDPRELSAVFDDLAIVPRGRPIASPGSAVAGEEGPRRDVTLEGAGLAVPLPGGARQRVRFGSVRPSRTVSR